MLPLLALHTLVEQRGDGLRPELLALLAHRAEGGLSAPIKPEGLPSPSLAITIHSEDLVSADDGRSQG
ncbi:hypothetical protein [Cupriavidus pauculus]|uniref:hypothetical protein n=1 Tax=Cupriavidus pauculus TaxID=82633 RepID=UPI001EE218D9|nr:hypothetical protein [Cupriavidus pauculus]GJG98818.1 hypothetical protein CBA19C6_30035 [Cupriavidus pauculus]